MLEESGKLEWGLSALEIDAISASSAALNNSRKHADASSGGTHMRMLTG